MIEGQVSPALPTAGDNSGTGGLVVKNNDTIRAFLLLASANEQLLPEQLRDLASDLSSQGSVPYRSLRSVWSSLPASTRPSITGIFSGAEFVFASPKPRVKSEDLKERLRKLSEMAERKEYEELVKDVVPKKEEAEPFSSYKDQIGFGLHVVVVMFTGYLVGFASFRALFNHSTVMNAAGGILGMVCGMLLETVLFILRASGKDMLSSSSASKQKKQQ